MLTSNLKKGTISILSIIGVFLNTSICNAQSLTTNSSGEIPGSSNLSLQGSEQREAAIENLLNELPFETSRITSICQKQITINPTFLSGDLRNDVIVQEYFRTNKVLPDIATVQNLGDEVPKGLGVRVIVSVHSISGGLNLSFLTSLIGIGLAANAHKITGSIAIETYGIGGRLLTSTMPVPTAVNLDSMADALATIKNIKAQLINPNEKFITALKWDGSKWETNNLPLISPIFQDQQQINAICKFF